MAAKRVAERTRTASDWGCVRMSTAVVVVVAIIASKPRGGKWCAGERL